MSLSSDLSHGDVTRILQIVDQLSNVEVRLEVEGMKLHVRKFAAGATGTPGSSIAPTVQLETFAPASTLAPSAPLPARIATPVAAEKPASGADEPELAATAPGADQSGLMAVRSPMLGRFFRAAAPTDEPYVEVGSRVEPGDTVCVIEVMKLFSTVNAGVRGTVVQVAVENGAMVEHDAVLFMVKPE
ncbi:MAG: biotin/lipoyl-containing protein [Caldimonas sp.]